MRIFWKRCKKSYGGWDPSVVTPACY